MAWPLNRLTVTALGPAGQRFELVLLRHTLRGLEVDFGAAQPGDDLVRRVNAVSHR